MSQEQTQYVWKLSDYVIAQSYPDFNVLLCRMLTKGYLDTGAPLTCRDEATGILQLHRRIQPTIDGILEGVVASQKTTLNDFRAFLEQHGYTFDKLGVTLCSKEGRLVIKQDGETARSFPNFSVLVGQLLSTGRMPSAAPITAVNDAGCLFYNPEISQRTNDLVELVSQEQVKLVAEVRVLLETRGYKFEEGTRSQ